MLARSNYILAIRNLLVKIYPNRFILARFNSGNKKTNGISFNSNFYCLVITILTVVIFHFSSSVSLVLQKYQKYVQNKKRKLILLRKFQTVFLKTKLGVWISFSFSFSYI